MNERRGSAGHIYTGGTVDLRQELDRYQSITGVKASWVVFFSL